MIQKYRWLPVAMVLCLLLIAAQLARAHADNGQPGFFHAVDQHGAVMLIIDPESANVLDANDAACSYYGYARAELIGMCMDNINTLPLPEIIVHTRDAAMRRHNLFQFQHMLSGGEVRNVEVLSYPVTYGVRQALLSVINDTTDRMLLEDQARQLTAAWIGLGALVLGLLTAMLAATLRSRKRLRGLNHTIRDTNRMLMTFINAQGDLAYMKDARGRYVFVNHAVESFFQKRASEIIGLDDRALADPAFAALQEQSDREVIEFSTLMRTDVAWNEHIYRTTKFPVKMADGQAGIGAYIRDVTEQRKSERRSKMESRRLKILSAIMTQDFKSLTERLNYVLNEALELTGSRYGYVFLYDDQSDAFSLSSFTASVLKDCGVERIKTMFRLEERGFWHEAVLKRAPVVVNDFDMNSYNSGMPAGHIALTRVAVAPVVIDGHIVAVAGLANKEAPYEENDVYELMLLMTGAWNEHKRHEAQARLAYERSRYLQTLVSIADGVMVVDHRGRIEILNSAAERLADWRAAEAMGKQYGEVFDIRHETPGEHLTDPVADALATGEVQSLGMESMLTTRAGATYNLEVSAAPIRDEAGAIAGAVVVFRDVTQKKRQLERIEYLSFHDPLTGLHNRRYLNDAFPRLDKTANMPVAVVVGDVNGLKLTNDVFGHAYGDILLKRIAHVINRCSRPGDVVVRWGGDEFVLILPETDAGGAEELIATVKREFAKEKVKAVKGSISMGYALKERPEINLSMVLSMAEEHMYSVKTFESNEASRSTVGDIIETLHRLNPREREHSVHVRAYAQRMGEALGLPVEMARKLRDAAYYHDIGKIVLDTELLDMRRPLSESEWIEIRKHPIAGYRVLNSFDDTVDLAETALAHHERWDGMGYPRGLAGDEIPLLARIVAVTEAYERMTNAADGARTLTKAQGIAELWRNAGTQFDPEIVEAFTSLLESED
ncbi:MAG: PAS domain-containing protein [Christensenellales bacterium]